MKKIIVFSIIIFTFILSIFVFTKVNAKSKLLSFQKQEILKLFKDIEKEEKEIKRLEKRIRDIPKGNDQEYNNLSKVKNINKKIKEITESIIGKKVDQVYQEWLGSSQTTSFTDSLNQAEKNIFGRIIELMQIREEKIKNEISDVEYDLEKSQSYLDYTNEKLKRLEKRHGKDAVLAIVAISMKKDKADNITKESQPKKRLSDSTLKSIVYATAKQLGWDKNEDYEMYYLDPKGYGGRFNTHTIQLGGSIGRIGVSYSKISGEIYSTSEKFAQNHCKVQKRDGYATKILKFGAKGGKEYDACYYYRSGSSKINNASIHLIIDNYRLFFDSEDLYWLHTDPTNAINTLISSFLTYY